MGSKSSATTQPALTKIAELIRDGKAKRIAVLTGAGISTSAGIPDFRSPGTGLYDNLQALNLPFPEAVFSLDYFEARPEPFWTLARDLYPGKYFPTPTHYFLTLLHRKGLLQRVWTQNIDTLETAAGVPKEKVIEAHGSFRESHCLDCGRHAPAEHVVSSGVREGKVVRCVHESCNGLVKPDIVFFGEGLPEEFFILQPELRKADLIIVIGTSMQVMPFAGLVNLAHPRTPRLLINREAVGPFEYLRSNQTRGNDSLWLGDADDGVRALVEELGWTEEFEKLCREERQRLDKEWGEREGVPAEGEKTEVEKSLERAKAAAEAEKAEKESEEPPADREEKVTSVSTEEDEKEAPAAAKEAGAAAAKPGEEGDEAVQKLSELIDQVKIDKADSADKADKTASSPPKRRSPSPDPKAKV